MREKIHSFQKLFTSLEKCLYEKIFSMFKKLFAY
jgi:hypothetical protein